MNSIITNMEATSDDLCGGYLVTGIPAATFGMFYFP
jgi:hypothetical protein